MAIPEEILDKLYLIEILHQTTTEFVEFYKKK